MSEAAQPATWRRSVIAVVAGLLTNIIPAVAIDAILHATGIYPPMGERMSDGLFAFASSYRVVAAIVGGYVTARLSPSRPVMHVLVLAGIGIVLSSAGAIAMWDAGPAWYSLGIIAIAVPCSLLGERMNRVVEAR
jgi:hypothetical protein